MFKSIGLHQYLLFLLIFCYLRLLNLFYCDPLQVQCVDILLLITVCIIIIYSVHIGGLCMLLRILQCVPEM